MNAPAHAPAIAAALSGNWKEAIRTNLEILKSDTTNVEALSRLAYAYLKSGQFTLARKTYQRVLEYDPYNQIAQKNVKKLGNLTRKDVQEAGSSRVSPMVFLEEPGKTKIVECVHVAPANVLSTLSAGQEVYLRSRNHCVEIRDTKKAYLGALPDDISFKLLKLLSWGNQYLAVVKSVDKKSLKVFLRETSRGRRVAHQPSFTPAGGALPYMRPTVSPGPDMTPTGEEEEGEQAAEHQEETS